MNVLWMFLALATPAEAACTLIQGGQIRAGARPVASDVKIVDERIEAVGSDLSAEHQGQACEVIDASGKQVTAGFIEVHSQLGLVEVGLEDGTRDADAGIDHPVRAALRVADAYNPRSSLIPIQRIDGVTGALIVPTGGRVAGQSAFVVLSGATQAETVVDPSVAMHAGIGGSSRAQGLRELRAVLRDARDFRSLEPSWERGQSREFRADGADLEALWPVLDKQIPLVVHADRASDIEAAIRLASEEDVRLVIHGAAEGHLVAQELARAEIPVIVDPYVYGPGSFGQIHARADNPQLLSEAGVQVILATSSSHNARLLGQAAGNAVRGGMSYGDALDAISAAPARVFGLEGRGELKAGNFADVVLWTGDPFELTTWAEAVWINGRSIPMESRQTHLRDAYRELPGSPRKPLSP